MTGWGHVHPDTMVSGLVGGGGVAVNPGEILHLMPPCLFLSSRLDGKHVVFGKVAEGEEIVKTVERYGSGSGKPSAKIIISDCGELWTGLIPPLPVLYIPHDGDLSPLPSSAPP